MTRLEQLESDVASLSASDLARFRDWFDAIAADTWDTVIEDDIRAGRLDTPANAAISNAALSASSSRT